MRLAAMLVTLRHLLGVEPTSAMRHAVPRAATSSMEERQRIDERLTRQQAALADLLASASLDEMRSRSPHPDA